MPARLVVYFILAMCSFSGQSYEEVARLLTAGLQGARHRRASCAVPSPVAIWKARSRLGVAPLRQLFARVCRPVAAPDTQGTFYREWRLTAIDGTTLDLLDMKRTWRRSAVRPGRANETSATRCSAWSAWWSAAHTPSFGAAIGALRTRERALAREALVSPRPGG